MLHIEISFQDPEYSDKVSYINIKETKIHKKKNFQLLHKIINNRETSFFYSEKMLLFSDDVKNAHSIFISFWKKNALVPFFFCSVRIAINWRWKCDVFLLFYTIHNPIGKKKKTIFPILMPCFSFVATLFLFIYLFAFILKIK